MEVIGEFSTGVTAQGAMIKIQTLSNSKIIFEKRLPSSGSLMVNIPKESYIVILDAGEGHLVQKDGFVTPDGGFLETKSFESKSNINFALYTTLTISILFLILAFI
ncbi:hypothetical protein [Halarcobacter anaerophilus]|uniref:hypothetical protein n=1 Tax=Halarcobacter anaerophilus TaxID=877500 RepID=UPI0006985CF8|nr:hypothetical protein [Halarcobacter anaerophilus]